MGMELEEIVVKTREKRPQRIVAASRVAANVREPQEVHRFRFARPSFARRPAACGTVVSCELTAAREALPAAPRRQ